MEGCVDLGYPAMHRPGVELATSRSQVRRPTTTLPSHPYPCFHTVTLPGSTTAPERRRVVLHSDDRNDWFVSGETQSRRRRRRRPLGLNQSMISWHTDTHDSDVFDTRQPCGWWIPPSSAVVISTHATPPTFPPIVLRRTFCEVDPMNRWLPRGNFTTASALWMMHRLSLNSSLSVDT